MEWFWIPKSKCQFMFFPCSICVGIHTYIVTGIHKYGCHIHTYICTCICDMKWKFESPSMVVHQASLSMDFSRQEYQCGLPFPSPGDLSNPRTELQFLVLAVQFHFRWAARGTLLRLFKFPKHWEWQSCLLFCFLFCSVKWLLSHIKGWGLVAKRTD